MTTISAKKTWRVEIMRLLAYCTMVVMGLLIAACGGGGSPSVSGVATAPPPPAASQAKDNANSFVLTEDTYGVQNPTYLSATSGDNGCVLRTAIASGMTDPGFRTIFRIDMKNPSAVTANVTYAVGSGNQSLTLFPGDIYIFNGHGSSMMKTVAGSITFSSFGTGSGDLVAGSFKLQVEDQNPAISPKATYSFAATFSFTLGNSAPITPAPSPVPAGAAANYDSRCASCHMLGDYDKSVSGAPDLTLKGGILSQKFTAGVVGHQGLVLTAEEIASLKIFLNAQ